MAGKIIKYGNDARAKLQKGVDKVANAVGITLGPKGRHVLLKRSWGTPHVSRDGVSIAREISLKDQFEDLGAHMIKTAALQTLESGGDGTSSACILAQSIFNEGLQLVTAGYNPIGLKRGIDKAVSIVVDRLKELAIPTQDPEIIAQVGTISANDPEIGQLIADAMLKVGKDGVITLGESQTHETVLEFSEGMNFDRGYITPYFVTNADKIEVELKDCFLFINDGRLEDIRVLLPLIQEVASTGKPILFIAEDYGQAFLQTLVQNKLSGALINCPIKAPGFGERRKEILKDIATLTNGSVFSNEAGLKFEMADMNHLGQAKRITVNRNSTTIVGGAGTKESIQQRIAQIQDDISNCDSDYDVEKMKERLAKLSGGVAVIKVGAPTEPEMKEKKDRVDDGLCATRSAVEEGIVAGGGVALLRCSGVVRALIETLSDRDEREGCKIILNALETPIRTIVKNAGGKPDIVVEKVSNNPDINYGFNAATDQYEDLILAGVIDPKKVVRCALQNAASVASMLITTEALVVDEVEEKEETDD
jgi:chaperonin GroEL